MNFGQAIEKMKAGAKMQRAGWNGKGMWVALTPGSTIRLADARVGAALHLARERNGGRDLGQIEAMRDSQMLTICPHIDMRAADGSLVIGWLASQTDMLADDWQEVA